MTAGNQAPLERMADFFDARAESYEEHMERSVSAFRHFYDAVAEPIPETDETVRILDIGCGTGLELDAMFQRVPNALITAIDISQGMLAELRKRHQARSDQLTVIIGSYLEVPFGEAAYDYVVAVMTLHHLLPGRKLELYRRIIRALRPGGTYIEGDWVVSPEEEGHYLSRYAERQRHLDPRDEGGYHIDVPLSLETERSLLIEAGFPSVDVIWRAEGNAVWVGHTR